MIKTKLQKHGNKYLHKIRNVQYLGYCNVNASIAYGVSETTSEFHND